MSALVYPYASALIITLVNPMGLTSLWSFFGHFWSYCVYHEQIEHNHVMNLSIWKKTKKKHKRHL